MAGKTTAIVLAVVIVVVLIGAIALVPGLLSSKTSTTSSLSSSTSAQQSIPMTSSSATSGQASSSSSVSNGTGTLAVLLTDPPTVPNGVTSVYINYSDIEVHFANAGNQTGWTNLETNGSIDLMSVINGSETVAASNITSGKFNGLRFNVTSAVVTYQGTNYTADLVYQDQTLYVWIPGGIIVNNGQASGAMIDISPTVLLLGNTTNPTFAFIPAATGYTLPANSIPNHPRVGDRNDWRNNPAIWQMTRFQLTAANLSPNSLNVTVDNTGNATIIFHIVAITATSTPSGGWVPASSLGAISKISEFFVVAPNGTLFPLTASTYHGVVQTLALAGFALAPGDSATFAYDGQVTIGALALLQGSTPTHAVVAGQKYIVTVTGGGQHAQTAVIAGTGTAISSSSSSTSTTTTTTTSSSTSVASSSTTSTSSTATTTISTSSATTTEESSSTTGATSSTTSS